MLVALMVGGPRRHVRLEHDLLQAFRPPQIARTGGNRCMDETRGRVTVPHGTHLPSLMLRAGECRLKATGREAPSHGVEVRHASTRCPVFSVEAAAQ